MLDRIVKHAWNEQPVKEVATSGASWEECFHYMQSCTFNFLGFPEVDMQLLEKLSIHIFTIRYFSILVKKSVIF